MKALTALEASNLFLEHNEDLKMIQFGGLQDRMIALKELISSFEKKIEFLSQPFNPEMIAEFFQDWKKLPHNTQDAYTNGEITIWFSKENGDMLNLWDCGLVKSPRTINDFISDCNRAGVQLNIKPEIAEKFKIKWEQLNGSVYRW